MMTDARPTPGSPPRAARGRWAAGFVILALGLLNASIATTGSLYADDFRESSYAAAAPWSSRWILGWNTYRHLAPLERAHYSFFVSTRPLDHGFAVGVMTLELMAALAALLVLARRLVPPRWVLVPVLLTGLTPLLTATNAWLVQAVSLYGVLIGVLVATNALLGHLADGRRRWLVIGALGWVLAALTWETWLAGPPTALLVAALWRDGGAWHVRLRDVLGRARWFWAMTALAVGAYLAAWWAGGYGTGAEVPDVGTIVRETWRSIVRLLVPGFAGGPWQWFAVEGSYSPLAAASAEALLVVAVGFTLAGVVAWTGDQRRTVQGATLFLGVPALVMALPIIGRNSQFPGLVATDPRYMAPAVPYAAVGLTCLGVAIMRSPLVRRLSPAGRTLLRVSVVVVAAASLFVTQSRFVEIWSRNPAGEYVARSGAALQGDPTARVYDSEVPADVLGRWFWPYNSTRLFLLPLTRGTQVQWGQAGSDSIFDARGDRVAARFYPLTWVGLYECAFLPAGTSREFVLPRPQAHEPALTLRVVVRTPAAGLASVEVPAYRGDRGVATRVLPLAPGTTEQFLLLDPVPIEAVTVSAGEQPLCVESIVVGQPAP